MARTKKAENKAVVSKISATSRMSVKRGETYYTVEYQEERIIPDGIPINLEEERRLLWDTVNAECDRQVEDIFRMTKK